MLRTFDEHRIRPVLSLNGYWDFAADPAGAGVKKRWFKNVPAASEKMPVPGCWNTKPAHFDYHGKAFYRRSVAVPRACNLLLTLEGTGGAATVWLDGKPLGRNPVSCLPWSVCVPGTKAGDHELVVEIDNSKPLEDVFPSYGNDWFHYGGLVRPVEAAFLGDIHIRSLRLPYALSKAGVALSIDADIANLGARDRTEDVVLDVNGETAATWKVRLPAGRTVRVRHSLPARKLGLWSPDAPRLHDVRLACGGDDLADRTGFRKMEWKKGGLVLNGKPLKLIGVNRHHEYGDNGFAVPADMTLRDFELIRDLGCNAVRCHYPIDSLAMDLCDELGLLVWSEIPFYGRWPAVVGKPDYLALAETAIERMTARDFNRPSVFVWSVGNECATHLPDGERALSRLIRKGRACDGTRPVGYASNQLLDDRVLKKLDVVGLNAYPGWYTEKKFVPWKELIPAIDAKLRKEGRRDMPLIVTETGGAGLYGDRSLEKRMWSEGFQADLLARHAKELLGHPRVAGLFIWQFADIRTIVEYWRNRPGLFNNKGLLDRFRRPKDAWWKVRDIYRTFAGMQDP
jgi:beta-glucuronidase